MNTIYDPEKVLRWACLNVQRSAVSDRNKQTIFQFKDECCSQALSKARISKYLRYLVRLAEWLGKEFPDANKGDIKRVVAEIENSHYVPHSKAELKTVLKKLYRWLRDSEEYPEEVRWIKTSSGKSGKKRLPEEILNTAEIKKLIKYAKNYRDRAFISLTYESGCRIGEILFVLIKHLEFDKYGVLVRVDGKTGPRRVRLVSSVHYLRDWLNVHPESENPEARLWMSYPGKPMTYAGICGMLQKTALRAGIKKRVNPHAFRHARATHLANHLTEAQMKVYFGWVRGSEMAAIYVHLSGRDVDQALLSKVYGLKLPERDQRKDQMRPVKCTRCGRDNPFTFKFCGLCGVPLNEKAAIEVIKQEQERTATDNVMDQLIQDSEFKEFMAQKIRELSAGRPQTHPQG